MYGIHCNLSSTDMNKQTAQKHLIYEKNGVISEYLSNIKVWIGYLENICILKIEKNV